PDATTDQTTEARTGTCALPRSLLRAAGISLAAQFVEPHVRLGGWSLHVSGRDRARRGDQAEAVVTVLARIPGVAIAGGQDYVHHLAGGDAMNAVPATCPRLLRPFLEAPPQR